jgi:hypothetical protein
MGIKEREEVQAKCIHNNSRKFPKSRERDAYFDTGSIQDTKQTEYPKTVPLHSILQLKELAQRTKEDY